MKFVFFFQPPIKVHTGLMYQILARMSNKMESELTTPLNAQDSLPWEFVVTSISSFVVSSLYWLTLFLWCKRLYFLGNAFSKWNSIIQTTYLIWFEPINSQDMLYGRSTKLSWIWYLIVRDCFNSSLPGREYCLVGREVYGSHDTEK